MTFPCRLAPPTRPEPPELEPPPPGDVMLVPSVKDVPLSVPCPTAARMASRFIDMIDTHLEPTTHRQQHVTNTTHTQQQQQQQNTDTTIPTTNKKITETQFAYINLLK